MLFILIPMLAVAGECINWPRVMTKAWVSNAQKGKFVVVGQFENYTKNTEDEWLSTGFSDILASMLSAGSDLGVSTASAVKNHPDAKKPDFAVSGMFQKMGGNLRVFVKLLNGSDQKLLAQYTATFPYPENREMFASLTKITHEILNFLKVSADNKRLDLISNATSSTIAYENYEKGMQMLHTYNINNMEVAKTWLDEARRKDYRFYFAYEGMVDLLSFLGFYHKQRGEAFASFFEQAEGEITKMQRVVKNAPKLTNRYLDGHASFKEGLIMAEAGNLSLAAEAFKRTVSLVPEDAMTWYQLARIYEQLGRTSDSTTALQKAYEVNSCIER